jgi:hypothetical protein
MRVGRGPGNNIGNVVFGENALDINSITDGYQNSAIGYQTLRLNTEGYQNSAVGYQALNTNTTGNNNTAVGALAIKELTANSNNTAIGFSAGNYNNSTNVGNKNTFLGALTGLNGNFSESTAIGYNARITASNQIKLGRNIDNVYSGENLLLQAPSDNHCYIRNVLTDTSKYLYLGANNENVVEIRNNGITVTATNGTMLTLQNKTAMYSSGSVGIEFFGAVHKMGTIECKEISQSLNTTTFYHTMSFFTSWDVYYKLEAIRITGTSNTATNCCSVKIFGTLVAVSYANASDYRVKENVVPLDASFTVDGLNPVTYNLKSSGQQDIGFIAHEVQEFYPFLVNGEKDGKETQSLNYNGFIGILTKEIQVLKKKEAKALVKAAEQDARLAEQEARIAEQEAKALAKAAEQDARISDQDQRIQALEKMMLDLINK